MAEIQITWTQAFHLMMLMLALPMQYYLVKYTGNTSEGARWSSIDSIVNSAKIFVETDFSLNAWKKWWTSYEFSIFKKIKKTIGSGPAVSECIPKEVLKYRNANGDFATSPLPRSKRPRNIKFRVGQVIRHKRFGYTGVIVGWDEACKAPEMWIQQMHGVEHTSWRKQPNYLVMVDEHDRASGGNTYVVEENVELAAKGTTVRNERVGDFFDFYDGVQYHMRPGLRELYPED